MGLRIDKKSLIVTLVTYEGPVCDVCGDPATCMRRDIISVEYAGLSAPSFMSGLIHYGCDRHPV